ncbi:hypothetical protein MYX77_13400 [Acidobacteriia bacterium AH_259_A11_L15]|nr:hypothetical protein [Acidobacteriia bacterium AH_259_A11_L15]
MFLAALKAGAPIIPVTIRGSRPVLAPRSWHIRPGRIEVILDPPIATADWKKEQLDELVRLVRSRMQANFQGVQ